jgi:hypothetical protein
MRHALLALSLALLAAACETTSGGGESSGTAQSPGGSLDLGDWRHATAAATLSQFQSMVGGRYGVGSPVSAAVADLRRNDFTCAENADTTGRGTPPTEICRKTVTAENCTGTWQVHFFDAHGDAHIARARALFDRRCGNEGLLGGPG